LRTLFGVRTRAIPAITLTPDLPLPRHERTQFRP